MKRFRTLVVAAFLTGTVHGQSFEVASIRESDPAAAGPGSPSGIVPNPAGLTIRNTTLRSAITWAYDEDGARVGVREGPNWVDSVRYDIVARSAAASSNKELRLMLRTLLADRFSLVVRTEKTASAVYALVVDQKGHTLRPAKPGGTRNIQSDATGFVFQNATMSDLQLFLLSRRPGLDRPVLNRTGLDGAFDFKLAMLNVADTDEARKAAIAAASTIAFVDALAPLGLKLEPQKVPLDVITIERVERPSEN